MCHVLMTHPFSCDIFSDCINQKDYFLITTFLVLPFDLMM